MKRFTYTLLTAITIAAAALSFPSPAHARPLYDHGQQVGPRAACAKILMKADGEDGHCRLMHLDDLRPGHRHHRSH